MILALCMVLSLCACNDKDVEITDPNKGDEILADEPIFSDTVSAPACVHDVSVALGNSGYTFEGEDFEDIPDETGFIHPIERYIVLKVNNGETVYFSDFGTEERAAEHAACYDSTGSHYENMIIDYAMPVHFWQAGSFIIEYGSETGELMYILNDIFGNEFAGAGSDFYKPAYAKELGEALVSEGYDTKFVKVLESDVMADDVSNLILNGVDNIYLYKYSTEELLLKHQGSPVDAPVLSVPTVWTDLSNLVAIEYGGNDEKVISLLNSVYAAELKEIPVHSIVYYRNSYYDEDYGNDLVEVIESLDGLNAYYEQNKDKYGFDDTWADATADYTAEWFEGNVLIMAKLIEGSGSISHEVTGVRKSGNNISVSIERIAPEIGTCDMAGWHIMMGISKADYAGCTVSLEVGADPYVVTVQGSNFAGIDPSIIRTDIIDWDMTYDETVVIDSFDKLEKYYDKHKNLFDLEHKEKVYSDTTIGFVDTFEMYNEKWFENNVLLMVVVEEGSGSIRHYLDHIHKSPNGELTIIFERVIPELCTDDMACWHIMVGLKREVYEGTTDVLLMINNVYEYFDDCEVFAEKPVIYLYPEDVTDVSVKLTVDGRLTCTYPKYEDGWKVVAHPDGTLTDENGQVYSYLYWEAPTDAEYDFTDGFCIKGEDTAEFLEDALDRLGLNRREANEFIIYWLPRMEQNEYNIISFQTDAYTKSARLEISPAPDTLIRVFMAYKPAENPVEIKAQELDAPERVGFTVVEWGGAAIE